MGAEGLIFLHSRIIESLAFAGKIGMIMQEFNPRKIGAVNVIGLWTLIEKEVLRFLNVFSQTIIAPVMTTFLFYTVFALAFGAIAKKVGDIPYLEFLAPGLLMMTMVQNAFANTSSSMVIAKFQGNIVDVLMPPISPAEFYTGYVVGGILRGLCVGGATALVLYMIVGIEIHSLAHIFLFALLGTMFLSSLGLAGGIWSERFDHISAVTNFLITPMTFLSGTFYSIGQLPEFWQKLALYNPFFYMIDGFRYGFIGQADGNVLTGIIFLLVLNFLMGALCLWMIRSGYKIKS